MIMFNNVNMHPFVLILIERAIGQIGSVFIKLAINKCNLYLVLSGLYWWFSVTFFGMKVIKVFQCLRHGLCTHTYQYFAFY